MADKEFWRNERVAFLALTGVKGVGFWTLHRIAKSGVGFKEALKNPHAAGIDKLLFADEDNAEYQENLWNLGLDLARWLRAANIELIFQSEEGFPPKLKSIEDAPLWLFVQGDASNLFRPAISVVGTRKPSEDGIFSTRFILAAASRYHCVTVSGLALGIDQTCHTESIRYGLPTVAVLGTGILNNYPKGSEELRDAIVGSGGTVISEYLPTQSYSAENFVRRNRLQAALGDLLFPTEWKIKSGTAHTVRYAYTFGKPIVNTFLPLTASVRPELRYSREEYGADAIELPFDVHKLTQILSSTLGPPKTADTEQGLNGNNATSEEQQLTLI